MCYIAIKIILNDFKLNVIVLVTNFAVVSLSSYSKIALALLDVLCTNILKGQTRFFVERDVVPRTLFIRQVQNLFMLAYV